MRKIIRQVKRGSRRKKRKNNDRKRRNRRRRDARTRKDTNKGA